MAKEVEARLREASSSQEGVIARFDDQLATVRAERDAIRDEVFTVIDKRSREFIERELAIQEEYDRIAQKRTQVDLEIQETINETIAKISALSALRAAAEEEEADIADVVEEADPEVDVTEDVEEAVADGVEEEPVVEDVEEATEEEPAKAAKGVDEDEAAAIERMQDEETVPVLDDDE
jgi:hypothetical protein